MLLTAITRITPALSVVMRGIGRGPPRHASRDNLPANTASAARLTSSAGGERRVEGGAEPGAEGPTDDVAVLELRARQTRNFLATLLLSQGIPMVLAGDELGRTQGGNNNAYCQDNEVSWIAWEHAGTELAEFVSGLIGLRRDHPVLRRRGFFQGRAIHGSEVEDIEWFTPAGEVMDDERWSASATRSLMIFLNGRGITEPGRRGEQIVDDSFVLCIHAGYEPLEFTVPDARWGAEWCVEVDTRGWELGVDQVISAGGPLAITLPKSITTTRSQVDITRPTSCSTRSTPMLRSSASRRMSCASSALSRSSSPAAGSSSITTDGPDATVRAMPTSRRRP